MANILSAPATLANAVWSEDKSNAFMRNAILAIAGTIALWISAKIQIPFYPVPLNMGTLVVLLIGAAYGWRLGLVTVALYLAEGAAGLPVFAGTPEKGIGLAYMLGGTGGYLVGFLLAVGAVGWLAERGFDRNFFTTALAMLLGNVLIYAPGLLWAGRLVWLGQADTGIGSLSIHSGRSDQTGSGGCDLARYLVSGEQDQGQMNPAQECVGLSASLL